MRAQSSSSVETCLFWPHLKRGRDFCRPLGSTEQRTRNVRVAGWQKLPASCELDQSGVKGEDGGGGGGRKLSVSTLQAVFMFVFKFASTLTLRDRK